MRDGILIIDKPAGMTSHDVVDRARRVLKTRRIGHAGTLDPFATGVLVLCVNRATRVAQYLMSHEKEYTATIRFGYATETGDLTGKPLAAPVRGDSVSREALSAALAAFRGKTMQVPSMYSARKIGGVKLYALARQGLTAERSPREIEITSLELLDDTPRIEQEAGCGDFEIRVVCSAGTYIRTLAEDISARLGVGAHLRALRRTRSGMCNLSDAVTLEELGERGEQLLEPVLDRLSFPIVEMTELELGRIIHGQACARAGDWRDGELASLCSASRRLVAIGEYRRATGAWHPRVVLSANGAQL